MAGGWIKIHRAITAWEWYRDGNTMRLFVHLLLTACRDCVQWHGLELQPGDVIASYPAIVEDLQLSEKMVRVAFGHLRDTGEISLVVQNRNGSVWRINKWADYQFDDCLQNQPEGHQKGHQKGQEKGQENSTSNTLETNDLQEQDECKGHQEGQEKGHQKGHLFKKYKNNNLSLNAPARDSFNNITSAHAQGVVPYPTTVAEVLQAAMIAGLMWDGRMAQDFLDHYTATGWQSQTGPLRDWRFKLRAWDERAKDYQAGRAGGDGKAKDRTAKGL